MIYRYFLSLIVLICTLPGLAQAALQSTTHKDARCNNGGQATYSYFEGQSENWLIYLQGGGLAANPESYKQRLESQTTPTEDGRFGYWYPMVRDFHEKGYHVIAIPYCSSDLYQGNHTHLIDGIEVQFRGRVIVEDIITQLESQLNTADTVVFAGYSAGSIGLGFNADLISRFDHAHIIADSFWLDDESLAMRLGWEGGRWDAIIEFLYPNLPAHCLDQHWAHCFPGRQNFERHGLSKVFPIWNIGDHYASPNRQATRQAIFNDITGYQAGFTMDAEKRQVRSFEDWGHVMTANDLYTKEFDGVTLQDVIWNWLEGRSPSYATLD